MVPFSQACRGCQLIANSHDVGILLSQRAVLGQKAANLCPKAGIVQKEREYVQLLLFLPFFLLIALLSDVVTSLRTCALGALRTNDRGHWPATADDVEVKEAAPPWHKLGKQGMPR